MADPHHKKQFLNMPKYPGGNASFREFIATNLRYPEAALNANIEGTVIVEYDIRDTGAVERMRIIKGLGHGCDEEAMRVVGLLRFEKVKNRGVRLKMTTKTTISFKLPGVRINYSSADNSGVQPPPDEQAQQDGGPVVYEYTVTF